MAPEGMEMVEGCHDWLETESVSVLSASEAVRGDRFQRHREFGAGNGDHAIVGAGDGAVAVLAVVEVP